MALELVGQVLECFAAGSWGRKTALNLHGQTRVA